MLADLHRTLPARALALWAAEEDPKKKRPVHKYTSRDLKPIATASEDESLSLSHTITGNIVMGTKSGSINIGEYVFFGSKLGSDYNGPPYSSNLLS